MEVNSIRSWLRDYNRAFLHSVGVQAQAEHLSFTSYSIIKELEEVRGRYVAFGDEDKGQYIGMPKPSSDISYYLFISSSFISSMFSSSLIGFSAVWVPVESSLPCIRSRVAP